MDEFYRVPLSSGEALATLAALKALHALTEGQGGIVTDVDPGVFESAAGRIAEELPEFVSVQAERLAAALAAALAEGLSGNSDGGFRVEERGEPPFPTQRSRTILEDAQRRGAPVEINYYVRSRDEWTRRRVDNVSVYEADGDWYLAGQCGLRHEHRQFRLDHVGGVRVLGAAGGRDEEDEDTFPNPFEGE